MKIDFNTIAFANIVKRVSRNLSSNKFLPYTANIRLTVLEDSSYLAVCDGNNTYIHKLNSGCGDGSYTGSVNGEKFVQLLSKITTERVTLVLEPDRIVVKGNGSYNFRLQPDEVPVFSLKELLGDEDIPCYTLPEPNMFNLAEAGLSKLVVNPNLMGYYMVSNNLITTNGVKLSIVNHDANMGENYYLTNKMVDLYKTCETEEATITCHNGVNIIQTPTKLIYGPVQSGFESYPNTLGFVENLELEKSFSVDSYFLNEVLDRLAILATEDVIIENLNGKIYVCIPENMETRELLAEDDEHEYVGKFQLSSLKELCEKHTGNVVVLYDTFNKPIKLLSKNITQVLAPKVEVERQ